MADKLTKAERKQAKEDKLQREQLKSAYQKVFSSPAGKLVLWDVLSMCNMFSEHPYDDPYRMAHAEGKRSIGLRIVDSVMEADRRIYIDMIKEQGNG